VTKKRKCAILQLTAACIIPPKFPAHSEKELNPRSGTGSAAKLCFNVCVLQAKGERGGVNIEMRMKRDSTTTKGEMEEKGEGSIRSPSRENH